MYVSLFAYALTAYDARWLFRLSARNIDSNEFAVLFGGGGEKKQKVAPARPPGVFMSFLTHQSDLTKNGGLVVLWCCSHTVTLCSKPINKKIKPSATPWFFRWENSTDLSIVLEGKISIEKLEHGLKWIKNLLNANFSMIEQRSPYTSSSPQEWEPSAALLASGCYC